MNHQNTQVCNVLILFFPFPCCGFHAIATKSFDALALPWRVPTTNLPSHLPHHLNASLITSSNRAKSCVSISSLLFSSLPDPFFLTRHPQPFLAKYFHLTSIIASHPTFNKPPTPPFPSSASHTANMRSNYNMLAMAAAAAQANAMPSSHLW